MNFEHGSRVGDYQIIQILGAGGMGRVYKVRNVLSDRAEAMKVLLPDMEGNLELADRFMREIKVQANLDHPNIAKLHTALRIENQLLMFMEYVEGTTLENLMQSGPLPVEKAVDFIAQVLIALSYAHSRGVIHRDLKPANMMITPSGVVKLMDFGIARMAADRKLTQTGSTVGSLYYMSPEQIQGMDLDPRSDLYSLGVTLYELVTGARPFQGDSDYSIMAAHLQGSPLPPIRISPNLPSGLNELILQALQKDPAKRFQTAAAFRTALLSLRKAVPQIARAGAVHARLQESGSKPGHRALWITVGALIVVVVLVVVAFQVPRFRKTVAENSPAQFPAAPAEVQPPSPVASAPAPPAASPENPAPPPASVPIKVTKTPAPASPKPASPIQQATPTVLPENAGTAEELKQVREQLNLLSIRMDTVKTSLDTLRRKQAASGLALRSDMASAEQRMEYYYSQTETALKSQDTDAAKKNLDLAEQEVSKLENFLGK